MTLRYSRGARPARAVVSLATDHPPFPERLARLEASVHRSRFSGEMVAWRPGMFPEGCPPHLDAPYAFKPFCLWEAQKRGFEVVLWLDTSIVVAGDLDAVFAGIEERGHLLFRNADRVVGEWCSDVALEWFGLDREEAMAMPEVEAAAVGLDLRSAASSSFLRDWHDAARAGTPFRGQEVPFATTQEVEASGGNQRSVVSADPRVKGHRHDQTVAGILAHRAGMAISERGLGVVFRYGPPAPSDAVLIKDKSGRLDERGRESWSRRARRTWARVRRATWGRVRPAGGPRRRRGPV